MTGLLKLTSKDGKINVGGLRLLFDAWDGIKLGFSSGPTLLDKSCFYLAIDYKDASKREFSGKASYYGELLGVFLQDTSVELAYQRGR